MCNLQQIQIESPQVNLLNTHYPNGYYKALYERSTEENEISGGRLLLRQQVVL